MPQWRAFKKQKKWKSPWPTAARARIPSVQWQIVFAFVSTACAEEVCVCVLAVPAV